MEMLQAHQGYLNAEIQLISNNNALVKIPKNRKITILWEEIPEKNETVAKIGDDEISKRRAIAKSLRGIIPSDVDVEGLKAERIAKRGLLE